jgi:hypothetical protein
MCLLLWGCANGQVYRTKPRNLEELQEGIASILATAIRSGSWKYADSAGVMWKCNMLRKKTLLNHPLFAVCFIKVSSKMKCLQPFKNK